MNALVADCYFGEVSKRGGKGVGVERNREVAGEGGVILVGDAAHQFPPAGGFGLNTGLQVSLTTLLSHLGLSQAWHCRNGWDGGLSIDVWNVY